MTDGDQRLAYLFWTVLALAMVALVTCLACYAMRCVYKWISVAMLLLMAIFLAFGTAIVLANL